MVYLIVCEENQTCKIGSASNLKQRLTQLRCSSPYDIQVYKAVSGGLFTEKELHKRFDEHRLLREWFKLSPEIVSYFDENACDIDAETAREKEVAAKRYAEDQANKVLWEKQRQASATHFHVPIERKFALKYSQEEIHILIKVGTHIYGLPENAMSHMIDVCAFLTKNNSYITDYIEFLDTLQTKGNNARSSKILDRFERVLSSSSPFAINQIDEFLDYVENKIYE